MARKEIVELIDDRNGRPADETLPFTFDGVAYSIDLSAKNATKLRDQMQPWISAASTVGRVKDVVLFQRFRGVAVRSNGSVPVPSSNGNGSSGNDKIRAWAKRNGHLVADRGRISAGIQAAYAGAQDK